MFIKPEGEGALPHIPMAISKRCLCWQRQISQCGDFRVAFQEASGVL